MVSSPPATGRPRAKQSKKPAAPKPTASDAKLPVRAAFYYPWYDKNPHTDSGGSQYTASASASALDYDQGDPATVDRQIKDMQYGGLQAGIAGILRDTVAGGEGTAAGSATQWSSPSGHGAYMDVLHDVFTAHSR
ncbi:hypothetical protein [Streptomyces sp. NPDC058466]|uniref:hypothetical protein n=1 Tax=Streptomyces sp. NPDC058466 TaxID=3346512 RepID=UPI003653FE64